MYAANSVGAPSAGGPAYQPVPVNAGNSVAAAPVYAGDQASFAPTAASPFAYSAPTANAAPNPPAKSHMSGAEKLFVALAALLVIGGAVTGAVLFMRGRNSAAGTSKENKQNPTTPKPAGSFYGDSGKTTETPQNDGSSATTEQPKSQTQETQQPPTERPQPKPQGTTEDEDVDEPREAAPQQQIGPEQQPKKDGEPKPVEQQAATTAPAEEPEESEKPEAPKVNVAAHGLEPHIPHNLSNILRAAPYIVSRLLIANQLFKGLDFPPLQNMMGKSWVGQSLKSLINDPNIRTLALYPAAFSGAGTVTDIYRWAADKTGHAPWMGLGAAGASLYYRDALNSLHPQVHKIALGTTAVLTGGHWLVKKCWRTAPTRPTAAPPPHPFPRPPFTPPPAR